jgi:hypothetical protein
MSRPFSRSGCWHPLQAKVLLLAVDALMDSRDMASRCTARHLQCRGRCRKCTNEQGAINFNPCIRFGSWWCCQI